MKGKTIKDGIGADSPMRSRRFYEGLYRTGSWLKGWDPWPLFLQQRERQWMPDTKWREEQAQRINHLLQHAYAHCSYYREMFDHHGIAVDGIVRSERFHEIPLLDRRTVKRRSNDLIAQRHLSNAIWNSSGGSTGEPVRIFQDQTFRDTARANKFLFDEWTGIKLGDKKLWLWGSERDLFKGKESWGDQLADLVNRRMKLNSFRMGKNHLPLYVERINQYKPDQMLCYVQSIEALAKYIHNEGLKVHSPVSIMTTAGTLYPDIRSLLEEVFGAPIFNRYGSREVGDIASECNHHRGLHVSAMTHLVEILREDGTPCQPGEVGEIVVTLLTNFAMPLIRYRIGDRGAWAEDACSCGRHWPLLSHIEGRVQDLFVSRAGQKVDGTFFIRMFFHVEWVRKFQVIQESYERITFRIVPENGAEQLTERAREDIARMIEQTRLALKDRIEVDIQFVEEILPGPSGKYRYVISHVARKEEENGGIGGGLVNGL